MSELVALPAKVTVSGGVIVREYRIPAGADLVTHKHPYDHLSMLLSGQVILMDGTNARLLTGPCSVEIKAGIEHGVHALTDSTWDCLHGFALAEISGDEHILSGVNV